MVAGGAVAVGDDHTVAAIGVVAAAAGGGHCFLELARYGAPKEPKEVPSDYRDTAAVVPHVAHDHHYISVLRLLRAAAVAVSTADDPLAQLAHL